MDGKTYGPYGGSLGENWESKIPLGCSVSYISGRGGGALDAISFHYQCPNGMYMWLKKVVNSALVKLVKHTFSLCLRISKCLPLSFR